MLSKGNIFLEEQGPKPTLEKIGGRIVNNIQSQEEQVKLESARHVRQKLHHMRAQRACAISWIVRLELDDGYDLEERTLRHDKKSTMIKKGNMRKSEIDRSARRCF